MTIGIAAHGPRAGEAVLEALRAVEAVSRGQIGGFATFAIITEDLESQVYTTQRGGSNRLFDVEDQVPDMPAGTERTCSPSIAASLPPPDVLKAPLAGLISSGPDRPDPLERFIAIDARVGLVTGHRSPDSRSISGTALNAEVLALMAQGVSTRGALERVMAANETADAGLIAADIAGNIAARDSSRVSSRGDVGSAHLVDPHTGAIVSVLHNAILPVAPIARLAAEIALAVMADWWVPKAWLTLRSGTPVTFGIEESVEVDEHWVARSVVTADTSLLQGVSNGAAPYLGARVMQDGKQIGVTLCEGNTVVAGGRLQSINGQDAYEIGFQMWPAAGSPE